MLEKQVSFAIVTDCVEDREMQSLTFSFVSITSSKLITVSCISMVLSLVKITGQLLRKFGRCYQSKNSPVEACNQHLCKSFLTLSNTSQKPPRMKILVYCQFCLLTFYPKLSFLAFNPRRTFNITAIILRLKYFYLQLFFPLLYSTPFARKIASLL